MWLAYQAHLANEIWNESVPVLEQAARARRAAARPPQPARRGDPGGGAVPAALRGEVRARHDPRSTLYNTDGQIFSDAGVPCVLFMENYDINRTGYHDTHDTMENIDLDYGAAVCRDHDRSGGAGGRLEGPAAMTDGEPGQATRASAIRLAVGGWQERPDLICRSPIFAGLGSPRIAAKQ